MCVFSTRMYVCVSTRFYVCILVEILKRSKVDQHVIQRVGVDGGIHPAGTVRRHLPPQHLQTGDQGIVAIILAGDAIGLFIILNPQGNIPGCPVLPTVEVGAVGDHGGESVHGGVV